MRLLLAAALSLLAVPALADSASGTVQSFDPGSGLLILQNNSVWKLPSGIAPAIHSGDEVTILYVPAQDQGAPVIESVTKK